MPGRGGEEDKGFGCESNLLNIKNVVSLEFSILGRVRGKVSGAVRFL